MDKTCFRHPSPSQRKKWKQCSYKPGSVPQSPFDGWSACHLSTPWVTPRLKHSTLRRTCVSDEQPSNDGIRELAASSQHSLAITRQLVVSYTTFSPLPLWGSQDRIKSDRGMRNHKGGSFLLPSPIVTNSFYFRKWSALCCPDFPLAPRRCQRQSQNTVFNCKVKQNHQI